VRGVFARSAYHWTDSRPTWHLFQRLWNALVDWVDSFHTASPGLFNWFLVACTLVLLGILGHLGWVIWRATRPSLATPRPAAGPAGVTQDAAAYLRRAEELAAGGRFTDALACRFIAVLLQLERVQALKFDPSKTPAEYVGEAKLGAQGRASLAGLVSVLYHHVFAAEPCDQVGYAAFGAQADQVIRYAAAG